MSTTTPTVAAHSRVRGRRWLSGDIASLAGVTLLAAALRLPTLAQQSFWLDEGYTARLLRMSFGSMLSTVPKSESTPPVYYVLAWVWTRVFTQSEFGVRSLSALAGIATIPVAYMVARRLAGARAGAIAGLLLAVAPLMVWFSQEARAYALATLLAAITLWCTVAYLEEGRDRWLVGWTVAGALGLATHYFVVFVVAPELVILLWCRRGDRRLALGVAVVVAAGLALVPLALAQRGTGHVDYIAQGALGTRVLQVPKQMLVGYASPGQVVTGLLAALAVAAGALPWLVIDARTRQRAAVPLVVGLAGVLVPIVLALVGIDFLDTRNLLPALPPLLIAAAVGFASDRGWPLSGWLSGALAVIMAVVVVLVDTNVHYQRSDWRGASRALGSATTTRAIVVDSRAAVIPLQAYLPRLVPLSRPTPVRELDVVSVASATRPGGGLPNPLRPTGPVPVPTGFHLVGASFGPTYTVLRYRAATPFTATQALSFANWLGPASYSTLVQPGRSGWRAEPPLSAGR
ncbi:MAG: glycosyltransferase family 39 protein [Solirubrobacteraceae bacterium]